MQGKEVTFRTGDGREFSCNEGSAAFELMSKDGTFTRVDGEPKVTSGTEAKTVSEAKAAADTGAAKVVKPLARMNKSELLAEAADRGLTYEKPDDLTKKDLIAAIEAADEAAAKENDPAE